MLAADKAALHSELKKNALRIREKELTFFVNNFSGVGAQAAFLAGFAFTGLFMHLSQQASLPLRVAFFTVTSCALGLMMITVANSVICNIFGPGLALRGPEGSMNTAVNNMSRERLWNFAYYGVGLVCFHASGILMAIIQFEPMVAIMVASILGFFLLQFLVMGVRLYHVFKIPADKVVSGRISLGGYVPDAGEAERHQSVGFCPGCGSKWTPGASFCARCGSAQDGKKAGAAASQAGAALSPGEASALLGGVSGKEALELSTGDKLRGMFRSSMSTSKTSQP